MFTDPLDVLDHVIQRVPFRVFEALRAARSALIDQHQLTVARHRLKRGEEVRVIRSGAPMQQQQRDTTAERLIVDAYTTAVDEALSVGRMPADESIAHFLRSPQGRMNRGRLSPACRDIYSRIDGTTQSSPPVRTRRAAYPFSSCNTNEL